MVVELHPDHLTPSKLARKMSGERDEGEQLRDAIHELKVSSLFRCDGNAVAPTHAALRAAALLTL